MCDFVFQCGASLCRPDPGLSAGGSYGELWPSGKDSSRANNLSPSIEESVGSLWLKLQFTIHVLQVKAGHYNNPLAQCCFITVRGSLAYMLTALSAEHLAIFTLAFTQINIKTKQLL